LGTDLKSVPNFREKEDDYGTVFGQGGAYRQ
jgi:hypothetical protein